MLNNSKIVTAEKIFRTEFNKAIAEMSSNNAYVRLGQLFMEITSTGAEEDYRWLGAMPQFEEWIGDANIDDLAEYSFTLRNKHFAAAVGVDEDEIADDKWNIILPRIRSQAERYLMHRGKLLESLILNGTTAKAFDGVAFFSDASGSRVNDNLLAGTISAGSPTVAQIEADIDTVRQAMFGFKDDKGEAIGVAPNVFFVNAKLERGFRQVAESAADPALTNAGASNPYRGWISGVYVLPGATDVNDFYAASMDYSLKPFVYQKRQDVEQNLVPQPLNRKLAFLADYRGAAGYTLPLLAAKVVSSVA